MNRPWAIAIHGGAGVHADRDYSRAEAFLYDLVRDGADRLKAGMTALDVVQALCEAMEDSGLFVAGRGSAPNTAGFIELDAALMEGHTRRAGSVCALKGFESPIAAARAVMERTDHVLMTAQGAERLALEAGLKTIDDPETWRTQPDGFLKRDLDTGHGTVGAVALDIQGHLAAATSTGGVYGKRAGRVGDTPLIGCGTWADDQVAVSCTGWGEAFIRTAAAHDFAARIRYGNQSLEAAGQGVLDAVASLGGDGGLIAIDRSGRIHMPFNTDGMKRAACAHDQDAIVGSVG
ncbi:isoaspartyl peptidase/L-asparaginase family protein [Asticcacaulis sp. AC402]|uniref:isoaspartyl peptidase/L-asparaginase family protein n=1 Tax=Asticcacaulis sp. AC402 TaxID=1282361 RepID=UPI0003C3C467|nr:isoaspartyl peptidase/L-asparaginase [Asticcacaulis sp. AC402]ESQ74265.1 hypothetical protein ABAC402_14965 [Asticcacaulis sp. AC402]